MSRKTKQIDRGPPRAAGRSPNPVRRGALPLLGGSLMVTGMATVLGVTDAAAQGTTTVRLGDSLTLKPYFLGQVDEAGFAQSRSGGQAAGFNLRRLRVGGRLEITDQVELGLIWDFGQTPGNLPTLWEAQASYVGLKPFRFTAGVFKINFGLESMQGAGDTLFLERNSISTITRNLAAGIRREGIQVQVDGERWNVAVAGTAGQAGRPDDGGQRAIVARAAGLPVKMGDLVVHLGVSGEWVFDPRRGANLREVSFSDREQLQIDNVSPSLSTGAIRAGSAGALGPEFGLGWRRLWLQGEYYSLIANRLGTAGEGTLHFNGWYGQAAYTVLGKPRTWNSKVGAWAAPTPEEAFNPRAGQFGAIELGVGYSTTDLRDRNVNGGVQRIASAVVNWWPVKPVRLSLLYENATVEGGRTPRSVNAVAARAQLAF